MSRVVVTPDQSVSYAQARRVYHFYSGVYSAAPPGPMRSAAGACRDLVYASLSAEQRQGIEDDRLGDRRDGMETARRNGLVLPPARNVSLIETCIDLYTAWGLDVPAHLHALAHQARSVPTWHVSGLPAAAEEEHDRWSAIAGTYATANRKAPPLPSPGLLRDAATSYAYWMGVGCGMLDAHGGCDFPGVLTPREELGLLWDRSTAAKITPDLAHVLSPEVWSPVSTCRDTADSARAAMEAARASAAMALLVRDGPGPTAYMRGVHTHTPHLEAT